MKKDTKLKIYNVLYWSVQIILFPFALIFFLTSMLYAHVFEPLDDALLNWAEKDEDK